MLLSALGLWFSLIMPGVNPWSKRFFLSFFGVLMLCCHAAIVEIALLNNGISGLTYRLSLFMTSLLMSLPLVMLTAYLLHASGEPINSSPLFRIAGGLWVFTIILMAGTLFNDRFYMIGPDMEFLRKPLYPLLILPLCVIMALNLIMNISLAARFGHGILFGLGLTFFGPIFYMILGLGTSEYNGNPDEGLPPRRVMYV